MNNQQAIPSTVQSTLKCSYSKPEGKKYIYILLRNLKIIGIQLKALLLLCLLQKQWTLWGQTFMSKWKERRWLQDHCPLVQWLGGREMMLKTPASGSPPCRIGPWSHQQSRASLSLLLIVIILGEERLDLIIISAVCFCESFCPCLCTSGAGNLARGGVLSTVS